MLLPGTARELERLVRTEQAERRLPSLRVALARDGDVVWSADAGTYATADGEPPSPQIRYRIGSISKTMTAVAVMQLRDEARLDLNDTLGEHLGDVPFAGVRLRELLTHSAGLPAEPAEPWWERSEGRDVAELYRLMPGPVHQAGTRFHYSNVGYALLGRVVSVLRDQPWRDVLARRIWAPLAMTNTDAVPGTYAAQGLSVQAFTGELTAEAVHETGAMAPAGQVWSTVEDLCRFATVFVRPPASVLTEDTVAEMSESSVAVGGGASYGLGLLVSELGGRRIVGHTGSMPGFLASCFADVGQRTVIALTANATAGMRCEALASELLSTVYRLEPALPQPWTPPAKVPELVKQVVGLWHWGEIALIAEWRDDRLCVATLGGPVGSRYRLDGDRFVGVAGYHAGEALDVVRTGAGEISHLRTASFIYTRSPYDPRAPIPGGVPER